MNKHLGCTWVRIFDSHFNISCCEQTGKRANGNFKGKEEGAKWEFKYCPYCGKEIFVFKPDEEEEIEVA